MSIYDEVVMSIIRPPRELYRISRLGPRSFTVASKLRAATTYHIQREDTVVMNKSDEKLYVSCYWIKELPKAPLTIYLHANNGSRNEGLQYLHPLLENGIAVALFDSSGSGMSDGEYITLGVQEAEDLEAVIEFVTTQRNVKEIALWGRSMGAVAGIKYGYAALIYVANTDRQIRACIYDSPFSSLKALIKQIAKKRTGIPEFIFSFLMPGINEKLSEKANISFDDFNLKDIVGDIRVPGFFIASDQDKLVHKNHSQKLHELYKVEKYIEYVECQHNQPRPKGIISKCTDFLKLKFKLKRPIGLNLLQIKYPSSSSDSRIRKSIKVQRTNPRTQMSEQLNEPQSLSQQHKDKEQGTKFDCLFQSMCNRDDRPPNPQPSRFSKKLNVHDPLKPPPQSHNPSPYRQPIQRKNTISNQASRIQIFQKKVFQGSQSQKSGLQQSFRAHNLITTPVNLTQSQPRFSVLTNSFHQRAVMSTRYPS